MIQFHHIIDATKVIEEYGFKLKNDKMCQANCFKLFGMIFLMEESRNEAIKYLEKALILFKQIGSIQGEASTYFLKSLAVKIHDYEDEYNNLNSEVDSKHFAEKAMMMYQLLKHREGFIQ